MRDVRLGKLEAIEDKRSLRFAAYVESVPRAPARGGARHAVRSFPMLGNDQHSDCVFAGAQHEMLQFRARAGRPAIRASEKATLEAYSAVTGYVPGRPETDQGAYVIDALKYRRSTGIQGRKIEAFAAVNWRQHEDVKLAVHLFGALGIGLALPLAAQAMMEESWRLGKNPSGPRWEPRSWGGHYVAVIQYDASGLTCVTWGELKRMSWQFFDAYCEEAWAILSPDWLSHGKSRQGFDLAALQADLAAIGSPG